MLSIKINQKKVAHFYFYFMFHFFKNINKKIKLLQLLIKICNEHCVVLDCNLFGKKHSCRCVTVNGSHGLKL